MDYRFTVSFFHTIFVLDTPDVIDITIKWEVIKRLVANQLHENLTPAGYSASRAFATEVSLSPAFVIATLQEQLGLTYINVYRSLFLLRSWRVYKMGLIITINTGNVLDEWVFNCHIGYVTLLFLEMRMI